MSREREANKKPAGGGGKAGVKAAKSRAKAAAAKGPTQRQLRVGEELRHVLSDVFLRADFRDPELAGERTTVSEVRISPDLRAATAFVSRLGRTDVEALLPALRRAAPYLRSLAATEMRLRVAPTLSFQPDTTLDKVMEIDALLRSPEVARDLE